METGQNPPPAGTSDPQTSKPVGDLSDPLLWKRLLFWIASFFVSAVRCSDWGKEKDMPGWEAASTALILFFVPVKGMLFFFLPQVWAVWANLLMIRTPFEVKRVEEAKYEGVGARQWHDIRSEFGPVFTF